MTSGVKVHPDVITRFTELKQKKSYKVLCCRLNPCFTEIVVDDELTLDYAADWDERRKWDDFSCKLPPDEGRYILWDAQYHTKQGVDKKKLQFVFWCPDTCSIKQRMLYASSKEIMKKQLVGLLSADLQANDRSDLDFDMLCEHLNK